MEWIQPHSTFLIPAWVLIVIALSACSSSPPVIPPEMESQIDSSLSFPELLVDPSSYKGKTVLLGGEILSAKRAKDGTQLEILQLPVRGEDPPALRRTESQGRFLALDREGRDPAAYPAGTRVTVVGEVTGESVQPLDESSYRYPAIDLKHLYVWEPEDYQRRRNAPVGLFGGLGFGFGGGRSGSFGGLGIGTGF